MSAFIENTAAERRHALEALTTDDLHAILCSLSKDIEFYNERLTSPHSTPDGRAMWQTGLAHRQAAYTRVMAVATLTVPF